MISFYDMWLRLDELTSYSQIDRVELTKSGSNYIYNFKDPSGGDGEFEVIMSKGTPIRNYDGIWGVDFRKNSSHSLTGASGGGATAVYGKVLAALKRLMEKEKVDGFKFVGAHPYMDVIYDKFTKAFGFVPVGQSVYMKKYIVEKEKASDVGGSVSADLDSAFTDHDKYIDGVKKSKNFFKQALKNKAAILGKVVGYDRYMHSDVIPAIVMDIDEDGFSLLKYMYEYRGEESWFMRETVKTKDLMRLKSPKKIPAVEMSDMLANMKNKESRIFKELQKYGLHNFDGSTYELGFDKEAT